MSRKNLEEVNDPSEKAHIPLSPLAPHLPLRSRRDASGRRGRFVHDLEESRPSALTVPSVRRAFCFGDGDDRGEYFVFEVADPSAALSDSRYLQSGVEGLPQDDVRSFQSGTGAVNIQLRISKWVVATSLDRVEGCGACPHVVLERLVGEMSLWLKGISCQVIPKSSAVCGGNVVVGLIPVQICNTQRHLKAFRTGISARGQNEVCDSISASSFPALKIRKAGSRTAGLSVHFLSGGAVRKWTPVPSESTRTSIRFLVAGKRSPK